MADRRFPRGRPRHPCRVRDGVTEPTNGLSQIWKTANVAAAAFSEQAGYLSVLPALIGMIIMLFAGIFVAIALGHSRAREGHPLGAAGHGADLHRLHVLQVDAQLRDGLDQPVPALRDDPPVRLRHRSVSHRRNGAGAHQDRSDLRQSRAEAQRLRRLHHAVHRRQRSSSSRSSRSRRELSAPWQRQLATSHAGAPTRAIYWSREAIGQSARQTQAAVHRVQARLRLAAAHWLPALPCSVRSPRTEPRGRP